MPSATDIRKGSVLVLDGELFVCTDFQHNTPGNKRGNVQTKLKSVQAGTTISRKFGSTERVEFAFLDKRPCEYLYRDGTGYVFMDRDSYEQVTFFEGTAVTVELPGSVELKVTHTDPGIKGDSVSNVFKPATLETGLEIKVPNHIRVGDVVKVSTQTGEFQGRSAS
jgi:elongation factor P